MDINRIAALRAERNGVVEFGKALSPEDWSPPSRCAGWTVQDVIAHMGAAHHGTFTPWVIKLMRTNALDRNNDADAERRRDWAPGKVFREYEKWSKRFLAIQPLLQHGPGRAIRIRLGEMGTYPARLLASAPITPGSGGVVRVANGPTSASAARISSPAGTFPLWATKRQPSRDSDVKIEGDQDVAERFLDSAVV
jgi:hypothetical protein